MQREFTHTRVELALHYYFTKSITLSLNCVEKVL